MMEVNWQKPEINPEVELGNEQLFWVAVESTQNKTGEPKTFVFLAHYQNRPTPEVEDHDDLPDWALQTEYGEPVHSVGWVNAQSHHDFDDFYEAIQFSDTYQLLGWADYTPPKFSGNNKLPRQPGI